MFEVAVVVSAEQGAVIDAGAPAVAVLGEVVGLAPGWRGVAAGKAAAQIPGDEGEALLFGEDALGAGVGGDCFRCGEQHGDDAGVAAGPAFREVGGYEVAVRAIAGGVAVPVVVLLVVV